MAEGETEETKLARVDERLKRIENLLDTIIENHENRIKSLEETRARQSGIIAFIGTVGTAFAAFGAWALNKLFG